MNRIHSSILSLSAVALTTLGAHATLSAQTVETADSANVEFMEILPDSTVVFHLDTVTPYEPAPLPRVLFTDAVYMPYQVLDTVSMNSLPPTTGTLAMQWIERERRMSAIYSRMRQHHAIYHPDEVKLNFDSLPAPPKVETVKVDDPTQALVAAEIAASTQPAAAPKVVVERQHWINKFNSNLQFSQAFISPNWYQGGNSSLNLVFDFLYNSQLNTKFHPNLLFENSFQWRTALTNAPEDEYRNYSITENRLQINSKFGLRAFNSKWYYTINGQFKTPVFNSYRFNSETMTASFLSPGELNLGLGMTYNTKVLKDKLEINVTVSPLSYNLKTVINKEVDETSHGLERGHKSLSSYGSSAEVSWTWKLCYNVTWRSRIFAFTNYERYQYDWQNTVTFNVNKFLTANLNVELHYDSTDQPREDTKWHKLQLKELISVGFSYTLSH